MASSPSSATISSDMNPTTEKEYYFKLENMLLGSCFFLRKLFQARWTTESGKKWQQTKEQGEKLISRINTPITNPAITDAILTGCLEEWDMATLVFVLQNYGNHQKYKVIGDYVQKLKKLRNDLSHLPHNSSKKLSQEDYHSNVTEFRKILKKLDVNEADAEEMIAMAGVTDSLAAVRITKVLYDEAKHVMDKNEFETALECFDKAISTPSLLRNQLATCFEKRADCFLQFALYKKENKLEAECIRLCDQSLQDASRALELNDNSWNAHFVLGRAYRLKHEWDKAVPHFNQTLDNVPSLQNVKDQLNACEILLSLKTGGTDVLSATTLPKKSEEKFSHWDLIFGSKLTEEEYQSTLKRAGGALPPGQENVYRGHQHRFGWCAGPTEMEAVRYYTKAYVDGNAEGSLSMALCLFDGTGIERDLKKGFQLWKIVAETPADKPGRPNCANKNDAVAKAQYGLGWLYAEGLAEKVAKQDYSKAVDWFKKATENGSGAAAFALAVFHFNGDGVPKDAELGAQYLGQAVKLNDPNGAAALMSYYIRNMELDKAFEIFKLGKEFRHEGLIEIREDEFWAATQGRADQRKRSENDVIEFERLHNLEAGELTFFERLQRKRSKSRLGRKTSESSKDHTTSSDETEDYNETSKTMEESGSNISTDTSDSDTIESPSSQSGEVRISNGGTGAVLKRKPHLSAPLRKELITQHRQLMSKALIFDKSQVNLPALGVLDRPPTLMHRPPMKMSKVSPIALKEMKISTDHIYEDRMLDLTIIDEPNLKLPMIHLIVEDLKGDVTRVFVNQEGCRKGVVEKLKFGCKIAILNPYKQIGTDASVLNSFENGIRVDDPRCLVCLGMIEKMCRFCGDKNVMKKCPACKKAVYCNKECQQFDINLMEHRKICSSI